MASSDSSLRILTLNCWGLKYFAKDRVQRISAIASELAASEYDIVALQELWVSADFGLIRSSVAHRLPHAKYFYSGALGSGLAFFSRFPIIGTSIHPYSLNGSPVDVAAGDWFVGKAAGSIIIDHPLLSEVEIYNTHFMAKGGEHGPEHHRAHRLVNAWEISKLIRQSATLGRYVIAVGDFNSVPSTLPMTVIREHTGMLDAWTETHKANSPSSAASVLSASNAIAVFGVTADSPLNTYSAGKGLDAHARKYLGKRLDYILYRHPVALEESKPRLLCTQTRVVFTDKIPHLNFSFSDHFGLEAIINVQQLPADSNSGPPSNASFSALPHLSEECLSTFLQAMMDRYRVSQSRSRLELTLFAACVVLLFAFVVSSAWTPRSWIHPFIVFFAAFVTWLGTTMLYSGFIFGNWERRALTNVIEELELTKRNWLDRTTFQDART